MKAAVLTGKQSLQIRDVPVPAIGDHEVLVKVESAFVCGTDVRFYSNGKTGVDEEHPIILGHEFAGTIYRMGPDFTGYSEGTPVAVAPNYGCGICDLCISGHSEMCRDSEALGVTQNGGFAQYVRIPEAAVRQGNLSVMPEGMTFAEAALTEPFSCVYNAYEKIGIYPGDTVLVIGSGPIGIMHCLMALSAGASRVFISDISEQRMDLAVSIDSRIEKLSAGDDQLDTLTELTKGKLADLVITAASIAKIQEQAFALAGINARVMFFGGLPSGKSQVQLDTNEIHYKQLTVAGTTRQSLRQYRRCLDIISSRRVDLRPLITSKSPVEGIGKAIEQVQSSRGLKQQITW